MTPALAIQTLHAALAECVRCGWVFTGTLEMVRPVHPAPNAITASHAMQLRGVMEKYACVMVVAPCPRTR